MGLDNASPMELAINIVMFVLIIPAILFMLYNLLKFILKHGITFFDKYAYDAYMISQKGGESCKSNIVYLFLLIGVIILFIIIIVAVSGGGDVLGILGGGGGGKRI
jgi:hypothetical protein